MKSALKTSDASFFALVHHVLQSSFHARADRRDQRRRRYSCQQYLAPYLDGRLPDQSQFRRVLCRDLSPSGFSFLTYQPPEYEFVVVALGTAPFIFVSAQIAHHVPMLIDREPMYLIGCRFMARIQAPGYCPSLGRRGVPVPPPLSSAADAVPAHLPSA